MGVLLSPAYSTASAVRQFDQLLRKTFHGIQLSPTMYNLAVQHYGSITRWLAADDYIRKFSPHLFHQGSMLLGTTVRPLWQAEYDLDIVCKLLLPSGLRRTPQDIYDMVWNRLNDHGTYRPKLTPMPRCIRITYEHDFHLDVVPAIFDPSRGGEFILIPDRPDPAMNLLVAWKTSNPKEFHKWFVGRCAVLVKMAEARIDPMGAFEDADDKAPLQLVVQLWKRWRDIRFKSMRELLPPSIILTTLAGEKYRGERFASVALGNILGEAVDLVRWGRPTLVNPVNRDEVISEKWEKDHDAFDAFRDEVMRFREQWMDLLNTHSIPTLIRELKKLFGEEVEAAYRDSVAVITKAREDKSLTIHRPTGNLSMLAGPGYSTVQRNTHHGD